MTQLHASKYIKDSAVNSVLSFFYPAIFFLSLTSK